MLFLPSYLETTLDAKHTHRTLPCPDPGAGQRPWLPGLGLYATFFLDMAWIIVDALGFYLIGLSAWFLSIILLGY